MRLSRLLVPYDGSIFSKNAVTTATNIAKRHDSKIHLITVLDSVPIDTKATFFPSLKHPNLRTSRGETLQQYVNLAYEKANSIMQQIVLNLQRKKIKSNYKVYSGNAADTILKYAKNKKIDLIVIGRKGMGERKKSMNMGSVSRKIVEASPCPVLLF